MASQKKTNKKVISNQNTSYFLEAKQQSQASTIEKDSVNVICVAAERPH